MSQDEAPFLLACSIAICLTFVSFGFRASSSLVQAAALASFASPVPQQSTVGFADIDNLNNKVVATYIHARLSHHC